MVGNINHINLIHAYNLSMIVQKVRHTMFSFRCFFLPNVICSVLRFGKVVLDNFIDIYLCVLLWLCAGTPISLSYTHENGAFHACFEIYLRIRLFWFSFLLILARWLRKMPILVENLRVTEVNFEQYFMGKSFNWLIHLFFNWFVFDKTMISIFSDIITISGGSS